jgi:hypothetical protein
MFDNFKEKLMSRNVRMVIKIPVAKSAELVKIIFGLGGLLISATDEEILSAREALLRMPPQLLIDPEVNPSSARTRAHNALYNATLNRISPPGAVRSIGELCRCSESKFLRIKNAGRAVLAEIRKELASHGLRFGMTDADLEAYLEGRSDSNGS